MIRWGMIGAGDVTEIKSGPAFSKIADSQLVAIMRRNEQKAADYAQRHNIQSYTTSIAELLNRSDINAIYIATPPSTHKEYALASLKAGKDVYLEKPMALNRLECEEIIAAAGTYGKKLSLAHYRRELPAFKRVKELIDSEIIGTAQMAKLEIFQPAQSDIIARTEDNWRIDPSISGGGLFHDIAPHQIDLMLHYFGTASKYSGFASALNGSSVDNLVSGQIQFANGTIFQGAWNFNAEKNQTRDICTVLGSKGTISFSFYKEQITVNSKSGCEEFSFSNPENLQLPLISRVVSYFLGRGENPCSGEEGLKVTEIMDAFTGK